MNKAFVQNDQATANVYKIKSNKYDKEYILQEQVGSGSEGIVYKGEEISFNRKERVAIKMLRSLNQQNIIEQFAEKKFDNLINVRDIVINSQGSYLIMDYADGEFYKYMQSDEYKQKSHREKCDLFIQIVQGVEELHEIQMIHRDLKPENILYRRNNGTIQLKLCDFGLIKNTTDLRQTANIGTPYYWAPEMISDMAFANYTQKVDIWALGMMWHEMITGKPMLIDYMTVQNIKQFIAKMDQKWINEQIDKVQQFLPQEKLILKTNILTKIPFQRITAKQLKEKLIELKNFKPFIPQFQYFSVQNQNIILKPKEFQKSTIFQLDIKLNQLSKKEGLALKQISDQEQLLSVKETELQLLQFKYQDLTQKFKEFKEIQQSLEQGKEQFLQQLQSAKKQFELDLVQLKNRTENIENKVKQQQLFNNNKQNEWALKEQQYKLEIKQIQQLYDEKITELNLKIQKLSEDKEAALHNKFQFEKQLTEKLMKESNLIQKIEENEKIISKQSEQIHKLQKNIEESNQFIQNKEIEYQLFKQKQEQSSLDLIKQNSSLQVQLNEKEQQQKNLASKLTQQEMECKKCQSDLMNEKKNMLLVLIKNLQQILNFQQIYYSDKAKKFNINFLIDQSPEKQYIEFLNPLQFELQNQIDNIQRIEHEILGNEQNLEDLNILFKSGQKIVLDVSNNIIKNYYQIKKNKLNLKERQVQVNQQKVKQEREEKSITDLEDNNIQKSYQILNEVQYNFKQITNQLIQNSSFDDFTKNIWQQVIYLQNQFEIEFIQAIQTQVKQPYQGDALIVCLDQIAKRYALNLQEQDQQMKNQLIEKNIKDLEETRKLNDKLQQREELVQNQSINKADFKNLIIEIETQFRVMITLIDELTSNLTAEFQNVKTDCIYLSCHQQTYQIQKLTLFKKFLSQVLDFCQALRKQPQSIQDMQRISHENDQRAEKIKGGEIKQIKGKSNSQVHQAINSDAKSQKQGKKSNKK